MPTHIIGGKFRGAQLLVPDNAPVRPTLGRIREDLFNILQPQIRGCRFLDLFAGAGTVGLEALSRSAEFCTFVDSHPVSVQAIRQNLQKLNLYSCYDIISLNSENAINTLSRQGQKFDLVFIDPPYDLNLPQNSISGVLAGGLLQSGGTIIVQAERSAALEERYPPCRLIRKKVYRGSSLWLFSEET